MNLYNKFKSKGNIWSKAYHNKIRDPGSIWAFLFTLTSFILLAVALGAQSSRNSGISSVFIAEINYSNARWNNILPNTQRNFNDITPFQRMGYFHNCEGTKNGGDFDVSDCYSAKSNNALDSRYPITRRNSQQLRKSSLNLPDGAVISRPNTNAILVLTTMACILTGISLLYQLFKFKYFVITKILAVIFLLVANIMVHVLAKRMVHSFNNNYGAYGIQASTGSRFLSMIWNAFGFLVASTIIQSVYLFTGRNEQNPSPKFDPEAMRRNEASSENTFVGHNGMYGHDYKMNNDQYYNQFQPPPAPTYQTTRS